MKRENFFGLFLGIGALVFALGMNYRYVFDDYGIKTNTLDKSVCANETSGSGGSSGSGSGGSGTSCSCGGSDPMTDHCYIERDGDETITWGDEYVNESTGEECREFTKVQRIECMVGGDDQCIAGTWTTTGLICFLPDPPKIIT